MKKRFYIKTFGCQMNFADSGMMKNLLAGGGFEFTEKPEEANLIIFNSCSVRAHAENRLFSNIGLFMKKYPRAKFILAGCTAKRFGQKIFKRFPHITAVISPSDEPAISEIAGEVLTGGRVAALGESEYPVIARTGGVSEFVVIQRGCSNFCSYCVVPSLRGAEKYRPPEDILREVSCLAEKETKEIVLLGQNVNSYRGDKNVPDFPALLGEVSKIKNIQRIRFLTSHPKDLSDKLIDEIAENPKVARHLHLPVQSGSDKILRLMNRGYTRENYLNVIRKLKKRIPCISLTTDIICGFPTEEEGDFEQTVSLVEEAGFDGVYVFMYSPRTGTGAAKMKDDVTENTKKERQQKILLLAKNLALKSAEKFRGREVKVLFERDGIGHSSQNFLVFKEGAGKGGFLDLRIRDILKWRLIA
ncbi:MAG: tRNA (N6-isopentenyl adenosine(37)-C2)-methylthiotransferase MiaB [bacterium]